MTALPKRIGWTIIRPLSALRGLPWNAITQAYLRALRPSKVRVIQEGPDGYMVKCDAWTWRVTVHVDAAGNIADILQEVEVDLPDGVQHGHDLNERCVREPRS